MRRLTALLLSSLVCTHVACRSGKPAATPSPTPTTAARRMHDHTPHHGGVVSMVGMMHLEARAESRGRIQVFLSDLWREPLSTAGASGTVSVHQRPDWDGVTLQPQGPYLEAAGAPFGGGELVAHIQLKLGDGQQLGANFLLPLSSERSGAAGVSALRCTPPASADGHAPRCIWQFERAITAVVHRTPDELLIAAVDGGITAWQLPEGTFVRAYAPVPAIAGPSDETPHADAIAAIAVAPDGSGIAAGSESRILIYDTAGQVRRELRPLKAPVRDLVWSARGLAVSSFYNARVAVLDPNGGQQLTDLAVPHEAGALAQWGNGFAVASETGAIFLFDQNASRLRELKGSTIGVRRLVTTANFVITTADDGMLRAWRAEDGSVWWNEPIDEPLSALAIRKRDELVAIGGVGGVLRLVDVAQRTITASLNWHKAQVTAVAWAGDMLVSGDASGMVALWDIDRVPDSTPMPAPGP